MKSRYERLRFLLAFLHEPFRGRCGAADTYAFHTLEHGEVNVILIFYMVWPRIDIKAFAEANMEMSSEEINKLAGGKAPETIADVLESIVVFGIR